MTPPPPRIGVIDYGLGNRRSVEKALERSGAVTTVTRELAELRRCHGLVLPGVGAFPLAMRNLRVLGLEEFLRAQAASGVPLLGICLGMQVLFESSVELEPTRGLALLPGHVTPLVAAGLRVPHIGWTEVRWERRSPLSHGLPPGGCPFYHVHSFAARPAAAEDVVASAEYGERFATVVARETVFGVQFHPEKSSRHGLQLMANFVRACARADRSIPDGSPAAVSAPG
ncbi:MAG TPA: imidazole glycerol phosphate synthase subunit HisH [Solirubrobacteraceae bacterium]|nr:imidazole glycerol phosphate synthase subunit HisH [Solirubrobacteraceae bacterium]